MDLGRVNAGVAGYPRHCVDASCAGFLGGCDGGNGCESHLQDRLLFGRRELQRLRHAFGCERPSVPHGRRESAVCRK